MSRSRLISAESGRPQAESFGIRLWSSLFIAAMFVGVSLLSSPVPGINEPHYLAKAKAFENPAWCSRDFFLSSSNAHYCFLWLTGSLTRWFSLTEIAIGGRIVSSLMLAIGWSMLGRTLALSAGSRIIAASGFAMLSLQGSFSGEWLLGGFESKVPAWGVSLAAVSLWIHGQLRTCPGWMTAAGVVCGTACSLHPVVGGWVAICICMASVLIWLKTLGRKEPRSHKPLVGLLCFTIATLVLSLPGLIPALRLVLDTSTPLKDRELASFFQVFWRLKHHLDPTEFVASQWIYAMLLLAAIVFGAWQLRRSRTKLEAGPNASVASMKALSAFDVLLKFFAMSAVIALIGIAIGWHTVPAQKLDGWEWRASLLKFYPFRCFDALLPITAGLMAGGLIQNLLSAAMSQSRLSKLSTIRWRGVSLLATCVLVVVMVLPFVQAWGSREVVPAGYTVEQFSEWLEACKWIRTHTPSDALVLTPRESFAFKWFSERAEFVCYKDCPQDAAGILTWNKRLWLLHDWTLSSSSDHRYDNADLGELRRQADCDFIVTRILGPFEAEPVWEGRQWRIYAVPLSQ